jgi:hypothetical protein
LLNTVDQDGYLAEVIPIREVGGGTDGPKGHISLRSIERLYISLVDLP